MWDSFEESITNDTKKWIPMYIRLLPSLGTINYKVQVRWVSKVYTDISIKIAMGWQDVCDIRDMCEFVYMDI